MSSCLLPRWSVQFRLVASPIMQTGFLPSVCFISGSRVKLPTKMTLLIDPIFSFTPFHCKFLHTISLRMSLFGIGKNCVMLCFVLHKAVEPGWREDNVVKHENI